MATGMKERPGWLGTDGMRQEKGGGSSLYGVFFFPVDSGELMTVVAREWYGCTCVLEHSG